MPTAAIGASIRAGATPAAEMIRSRNSGYLEAASFLRGKAVDEETDQERGSQCPDNDTQQARPHGAAVLEPVSAIVLRAANDAGHAL